MSWEETIQYCDVVGCTRNSSDFPETTFFPIPTYKWDPKRRHRWLEVIGRPEYFEDRPYRHVLVCSKHFGNVYKYFPPNSEEPQLTINAIPTMHLPSIANFDEVKKKQAEYITQQINLATVIDETQKKELPIISPQTIDLIMKLIARLHEEVNSDRLYTEEYKNIVLRLYFENTSTYHVSQSDLKLPPVLYLPKFISSKQEALNDIFIQSLKAQVDLMPYDQLYCTLCVSLIKLEPEFTYDIQTDKFEGYLEVGHDIMPANYALVGMARGLFHEWQHIAGVTTIATLENFADFHTWIENVMSKMFEIGLNLKLVISDTQNYLISALTQRSVSLEEPYFFTNEKNKIYYMFDAFHLLQLVYSDLKENNFHSSYDPIIKLYENDQIRELKLAPQLTDKHINPKASQSLMEKLRHIADIFSLDTSSGLEKSFKLGLLEEQAMETAKVIRSLNRLLASSNKPRNIFSKLAFEEDFSIQMVHTFSGLEFIDADFDFFRRVSYICFIVTLNCLPLLRNDLEAEMETILNTSYINQDPLVDVIDKARLKTCNYKDPTKTELFEALKICLVQNLKIRQSSKSMDNFLETAQEIISLKNIRIDKVDFGTEIWRAVELETSEASSLLFMTSFLLDHVFQNHKKCKPFNYLARSSRIHFVCEGNKQLTLVPNNYFIQFVEKMDMFFIEHFATAIKKGSVIATLMDLGKNLNETRMLYCRCLPISLVKEIFMSLRVYYTVKYNNELLLKKLTDVLVVPALQ